MNLKFLKKTIISAFLVSAVSFGTVNAANPVGQQAYYDTFTFKVNGVVQYINDITKKPFIANSRVYVPISTLSDLGIASVKWIPSNSGIPAELQITPATNVTDDKSAYYDQKINELATEIAKKDTKIKELEDTIKKLTDENTDLKKKKEEESKPSSDDREVRNKLSDLEYDLNKDREFRKIDINGKTFDIKYELSYRRERFDVTMSIKGLTADEIDRLRTSRRDEERLDDLAKDVIKEIQSSKTFKNVDISLVVYDSDNKNKEIADYTYKEKDGKLKGGLSI